MICVTRLIHFPKSAVWITDKKHQPMLGRVIEPAAAPHSYIVTTEDGGQLRRNRQHLNVIPENPKTLTSWEDVTQQTQQKQPSETQAETKDSEPKQVQRSYQMMTRSQTGASIHPPERYGMVVSTSCSVEREMWCKLYAMYNY